MFIRKKSWSTPHTYIIIFIIILLASALTYIIPIGQYQVQCYTYMQKGTQQTKNILIPNSFSYVLDKEGKPIKSPTPIFGTEDFGKQGVMNYVFEGLTSGTKRGSAIGIIAFILVLGGSFGIVLRTGAIDCGILAMIHKSGPRENYILSMIFVLFSFGGAVFGMGEQSIAFSMILVPMVIAMGYDAIVAVCISYVAAQIGFATSWMNPFTVAIAQGISDIPIMSGAKFRIILWTIFTAVGLFYTLRYAAKVKENPTISVSYGSDAFFRESYHMAKVKKEPFQLGHMFVMLTVFITILWTLWGVTQKGYFIPEIASQFFVMGLLSGIMGVIFHLNHMTFNDIATAFQSGASDLVGTALVVGMAQGIVIVLGGTSISNGTVLNTLLYYASSSMQGFGRYVSALLMYAFQTIFNVVVVSTSGQAALTMPLMAPLSDLVSITRQTAVLAFQLGTGLTSMIAPTSGCLLGVLGIARLSWSTWFRFQIKLQGILIILASIAILLSVFIQYR